MSFRLCEARFIDGPLDGRRKVIEYPVPAEYIVPCMMRIDLQSLNSNQDEPIRHSVAVYELWDNWPVRYKFVRYGERL